MTHRAGGGLVLLLAVLSLLVVPRVLNPPAVVGSARIEPPEPPPAVGTCLANASAGYGIREDGRLTADVRPAVISCSEPHNAEVVFVDTEVVPARPYDDIVLAVDDVMTGCFRETGDLWSYFGQPPGATQRYEHGEWLATHDVWTSLVGPDDTQWSHGARWAACVVGVGDDTLHKPLRDIVTRSGGIPAELSSCYRERPDASNTESIRVSCAAPHQAEVLGVTPLSDETAGTVADNSAMPDRCRTLAAEATRRSGIQDDPALTIQVLAYLWSSDGLIVTQGIPAELPADLDGAWAECTITVTDPDRQLTGSLRLLGDAPLPWA